MQHPCSLFYETNNILLARCACRGVCVSIVCVFQTFWTEKPQLGAFYVCMCVCVCVCACVCVCLSVSLSVLTVSHRITLSRNNSEFLVTVKTHACTHMHTRAHTHTSPDTLTMHTVSILCPIIPPVSHYSRKSGGRFRPLLAVESTSEPASRPQGAPTHG